MMPTNHINQHGMITLRMHAVALIVCPTYLGDNQQLSNWFYDVHKGRSCLVTENLYSYHRLEKSSILEENLRSSIIPSYILSIYPWINVILTLHQGNFSFQPTETVAEKHNQSKRRDVESHPNCSNYNIVSFP